MSPQPSTTSAAGWQRSVGLLAMATIAIGVANYLTSLVAVRFLPAGQFANFAAGQGLLLVLGTGSFAALPWAVARFLARSTEPDAARQAMHFGLTGSAIQAVVLAPVALVVCWSLDGPLFGLVGAIATVMISLLAGPVGFLQGSHQLSAIAAVRSLETAVRIAVTMLLIFAVTRDAAIVLVAFPVGSALALAYALHQGRVGFPLRPLPRATALRLTRDAALLGGIQVLLAMLGALDTVYADAGHFTPAQAAAYQAAALLARIPLFFSAAVATAAYTDLAAAPDEASAGRQLRAAMHTYLWLAVPFLIAYLTLPQRLLDLVIPAEYTQTLPVLRLMCVAGVLVGAINVLTTAHQARGGFGRCIAILLAGVAVQGVALVWFGRTGHLMLFAAAASLVCVATLAFLLHDARRWLRGARLSRPVVSWQPALLVVASAVAVLDRQPVLWLAMLTLVAVSCASLAFAGKAADHSQTLDPPENPASPDPRTTTPRIEELSR